MKGEKSCFARYGGGTRPKRREKMKNESQRLPVETTDLIVSIIHMTWPQYWLKFDFFLNLHIDMQRLLKWFKFINFNDLNVI